MNDNFGKIPDAETWELIRNVFDDSQSYLASGMNEESIEVVLPRDFLGELVRDAWIKWAKQQPKPKPSWLVPYWELSEADKEADRQIGEAVWNWAFKIKGAMLAPSADFASGQSVELERNAVLIEAALIAGTHCTRCAELIKARMNTPATQPQASGQSANLALKQEPLGEEFGKVLSDNLESLYVEDVPATPPQASADDVRECHKCGLPMSVNPHPEAGKPPHYLEVGCPKECIPCLSKSRHSWAQQAMKDAHDAKRYRVARKKRYINRVEEHEIDKIIAAERASTETNSASDEGGAK